MKKIIMIFSVLLVGITLFSCANSMDEIGARKSRSVETGYATNNTIPPVEQGYLRINTLSKTADNLWIWNDFAPSATAECKSWDDATGGYKSNKKENGDFVCFDVKLLDASQQVGFIVRKGTTKLSGDADIIYLFPAKYTEIFLKDGSGKIYIDSACTKEPAGLASAIITGEHKITATISGITLSTDNVKVLQSDKTTEIDIESIDSNVINVTESLKEVGTVYVQYKDAIGTDERIANFDSSLVDEWFADVDIATLGYNDGVFKTWAPFASTAKVLLFADAKKTSGRDYEVATEIPMIRNNDGTWKTENVSAIVGSNKYYKYSFMNNGVQYDVCDIWAKVASKDSTASAIEKIGTNAYEPSYKNPFGNSGVEQKLYNDAVIYEMHITDWSQAFRSSVKEDTPGTFKEITAALENGNGEFAKHLKDLGVTHVQILPMFEYAVTTKGELNGDKVDFLENDNAYNWGYNPYNYNTPESRYVQDMRDGSDAVDQMREMVAAFHKTGIAVIMDVVYNHTAGTGNGSIYDMTVPKYFYRMDSQGNYSNGSGCGNETATNHEMVKKYVIDSLKHWMNDYHINGFRFDLMGIHESKTMQEIYKELSEIDKNVMVYGEPWTAEGHPDDSCEGAVAASDATGGNGVGAFDDNFRDAIKGGEYGGFNVGQVQTANSDSGIINGLTGKSDRNKTNMSGLALHYIECHDNFTLYDKLVYSLEETLSDVQAADKKGAIATKWPSSVSNKQINLIKKQDKLAAAYLLLAQGTPFINGGQEFLRTKKGDPDSYAADKKGGVFWSNIDAVNAIDFSFKEKYSDVYNTYKGLIALRKSSPAFTNGTDSTARSLSKGVTLYNAKSGSDEYEVIFNATDSDYIFTTINIEGQIGLAVSDYEVSFGRKGKRVTISETDGSVFIANTETAISTVPAHSFVILKK